MSKSLGNSPDVLRLMEDYGADAVRMGMLLGTSAGNDIIFDESLCEQGRNFANKIWNALRLVDSWRERVADRQPTHQEQLASDWMRARVNQAGQELEQYFAQYRTMDIALTVYKLTWEDFCSWYLEAVKPGAEQTLSKQTFEATLGYFEELMMLLHPYMPFITEEVWHLLSHREKNASICVARLRPYDFTQEEQSLVEEMAEAQTLIRDIRAFRSTHQLPNRQLIPLSVRSQKPGLVQKFAPLIEDAAQIKEIHFVEEKPGQAHVLVSGIHELFIDSQALGIDSAEERQKIQEEIDYLKGFLKKVEQKLSNEKFINNAPEEVVAKERQKKYDTEQRLRVLENSLAQLEG
jgi:valyl-tRNA synthetase